MSKDKKVRRDRFVDTDDNVSFKVSDDDTADKDAEKKKSKKVDNEGWEEIEVKKAAQ